MASAEAKAAKAATKAAAAKGDRILIDDPHAKPLGPVAQARAEGRSQAPAKT